LYAAIADIPHNCNFCGLRGEDLNWCEYHDRVLCSNDKEYGCRSWKWRGICEKKEPFLKSGTIKISFNENDSARDCAELTDISEEEINQLLFEIDVVTEKVKSDFNPYYDSQIRLLVDNKEMFYLIEFNKDDLKRMKKEIVELTKTKEM
jgi:hypothetical protein